VTADSRREPTEHSRLPVFRLPKKKLKHKLSPMKRIALFPGTFDPITIGHMDIIQRAIPLFDKLIIGIGRNASKTSMFSEEIRLQWVNEIFKNEPQVSAIIYEGLTIECCQKVGANFIIRGIRYVNDFEYEKAIADMNRSLDPEIETVFLTCLPQYTSVASTLVRDVIRNGGNASPFLPEVVADALAKKNMSVKK
jgi:pantetheine-phosphate adenylyltransferase